MGVKHIVVLPTVVSASIYTPMPVARKKYNNKIIIGWVGSPVSVWTIDSVRAALINIAKNIPFVLYVIGANYSISEIETHCIDWRSGWNETEEIRLTNEIDIGIMPLPDEPYQRGKGGFKLIKYMACAKPVIASPVGVNVEIVDHDKNGYLASTSEEWEKYLLLLIHDAEKRKYFGLNGRKKMVTFYSLQATSPIFCDIVKSAVSKH